MASPLDQIVKGAPPPNVSITTVVSPPPPSAATSPTDRLAKLKTPRPPHPPGDPTSLLPSSPPQIYLNLLILEASLRAQYLTLRARRRQNSFVLILLAGWLCVFTWHVFLRPRDDGQGVGGSQYWLLDTLQKIGFTTGVFSLILFWATGQWERGVRWPRRWVGITNRGLRGMNCKIVVIRGTWWTEFKGWLKFVMPFSGGLWGGIEDGAGSSFHYVVDDGSGKEKSQRRDGVAEAGGRPRHRILASDGTIWSEEDVAPGGDYIKVLLLPKPFSPDFRENWEVYRTEYWERENERRAELRKRVRARQREIAREEGGWLWWTGWRGWKRGANSKSQYPFDLEKTGSHTHTHLHSSTGSQHLKDRKRRPSTLLKDRGRDGSHSRSSSRSTTPTPDLDGERGSRSSLEPRERRYSNASTAASDRRRGKKPSSSSLNSGVPSRQSSRLSTSSAGSRPSTPLDGQNSPSQSRRWNSLNAESMEERAGARSTGAGAEAEADREDGKVFPNAMSA